MMGFYVDENSAGPGLRGGRFIGHGWPRLGLRMENDRWVRDATVTGKGTWSTTTGRVVAVLTVTGPGGGLTRLRLSWSENRPLAFAQVLGLHRATLRFPAP
jgi:hypothetical protein